MNALHVSFNAMRRACVVGATAAGAAYLKYHTEAPPLEADFPRDWQPDYLDEYWRRRPCYAWARCFEVAWVLGPVAAKCGLDMGLGSSRDSDVVRARAREFRSALTRLGPAFIKLGQALSIRPDVLPIEAIEELRKLCDSVPEIPTDIALATVRAELNGQDPAELFLDLNDNTPPIAAASLGQVYRCRLRSSGQTVAIKVQKPDVVAAVALDLILLRRWAHLVEGVKRRISQQRAYDVALIESFGQGAWGELDYGAEADNQTRMAQALARAASRRLRNQVVVPRVRIATRKLLVTDWIHGDQLCRASPELIKRLVPLGVELFIWQLLDLGEYHCDPHPGNLLVDNQGRLALIDFGLCCRIERPNCEAMTKAVVHLIQGNVPALLEDAVGLDFLPPDVDRESLLPVLQRIFDDAQLAADKSGVAATQFQSVSNRRKQFFAVSNDLNSIFFEYPFSVPDYFALITRALIILEGASIVLAVGTRMSFVQREFTLFFFFGA